ncbi:MAG: hypothetical protein RLZZ293_718 [Pseudomonadota bacterium]|jgi:HAE1 family hydrophobic/amphiphilic exporter-1/multidrug efflux pump
MFCRFFILRPVLSVVLAIIITLAGLVSMAVSPIEQYPNIVPPCLNIVVPFPGANSETIANAVAAPIEDQMSGVAGMIYMQSASQNGNNALSLNVYFDVGTNLQAVEADALNRIQTAMPQLPPQVQAQGVTMRMQNPDLFMLTPFYSETGKPDLLYISNYVQRYIYPLVEQIRGVGVVSIFGQRQYAMRILTDPNKMKYYNIGISDIQKAVSDQNWPYAIGLTAMAPMQGSQKYNFLMNSTGYMTEESQFENIVIRASESNAQVVKIKDIAKVKLEAQQYVTYYNSVVRDPKTGKAIHYPATAIGIYLAPGANELEVKKQYTQLLNQIAEHMPNGIKFYNHYDSSEFVITSINSVVSTLFIAFGLVFLVVFLFIQNIRGTIIPIIAIPVAIIGTFAGTYVLGFSINTLTLFGMVLAIGIVVDDAIVVLENVERLMTEEGLSPLDAAIKGMEQVAGPVIAVVCVLNAVFVPVAFLGGFSGVLMQQFAVTIAISVLLSGIIALTLTPTLCAMFLQHKSTSSKPNPLAQQLNKLFAGFNYGFSALQNGYIYLVTKIIDNQTKAILIWCAVVITVILSFVKIPTGLIPLEDMGYFYSTERVNAAGSIEYNIQQQLQYAEEVMNKIPYIQRVAVMAGKDIVDNGSIKTNTSTLSLILKDQNQRNLATQGVNQAIEQTNQILQEHKRMAGYVYNQPPIRGMSPTGGVTFYLQSAIPDISVNDIANDSKKLVAYLMEHYPDIVSKANQMYVTTTPELNVKVDPRKAYAYKVPYQNIFNSLQSVFGLYYINYFTKWNDLWWVLVQSEYDYRKNPQLFNVVYVKNTDGVMIPIGSLATLEYTTGPEVVTRFNDFLASQIIVDPANGKTSGEVMQIVKEAVPKVLGGKYYIKWFGPAYQQNIAGNKSLIAFGLGLVMVFLILAALYEMWSLPLAILMALPFALLGAALTLLIFHMPNNIYFQVSMLTLIGLSAKNAILIIEFAIEAVRNEGKSYREAAIHAASVRFRPIVMTSLAFILGAIPLATATGAGANSQHSVGYGIIGGMLGSTCIATLFVPLFFILVMNWSKKPKP